MHIITTTACIYILAANYLDASTPDRTTQATPGKWQAWIRRLSSFISLSPGQSKQQSEPSPQAETSTTAAQAQTSTTAAQAQTSTTAAQDQTSATATQAQTSTTAGQAQTSTTAAQAQTSTTTTQAQTSTTAAQAETSTTATQAERSTTAAQAQTSTTATQAETSTTAAQAETSTTATQAETSTTATQAETSTTAAQAETSTTAAQAETSTTAAQAQTSTTAAQAETAAAQAQTSTTAAQAETSTTAAQAQTSTTAAQAETSTTAAQAQTSTTAAAEEQYERMPESRIQSSFGCPSRGLQYDTLRTTYYNCGSRRCKKIATRGDGHCYYHAIALSTYYGRHKRRYTPSGHEILNQMVKVLLSNVMQTLHDIIPYPYNPRDEDRRKERVDQLDSAAKECEVLGVQKKALDVYTALPRRDNSGKALQLAKYVDLVCRYPKDADLRETQAISIFRCRTYIPGVEEIGHAFEGINPDRVIEGEIVIAHDPGHYSGLDCTVYPNPSQESLADEAEISYEKDTTFAVAYSHTVGNRIRCSHRECEVLDQPNRQYSYLHALFTSAQKTGLGDPHTTVDDQIVTWLTTAANTIFKDAENFNNAMKMYLELIQQSIPKQIVQNTELDLMNAIPFQYLDFFLQQLKMSVNIGHDVERQIRQEEDIDSGMWRHLIFTVYCYINGLGVFAPAMVLVNHYVQMNLDFTVTECLLKQGGSRVTDDVIECDATENALSGEPVAEATRNEAVVAVVSTIIKLEPARHPEVHYFGLRCDS